MQAEKLLALIKCAQAHEKKKMKNIDMKYQKRGRKKFFFHILFLYVWRIKIENKMVYYKMIFVLLFVA